MPKLLILADDFTGALDTGVQLAGRGAETRVITNVNFDLSSLEETVEVLVVDTETRHMKSEDAYAVVYKIAEKAVEQGIPYIYKKTDSALRGNIGAELSAVLHASGSSRLSFIPAFPKMNRITRDGIHYVDGLPVNESVFGIDPFEPVTCADVSEIIRKDRMLLTRNVTRNLNTAELHKKNLSPEILIWDASSDEDLVYISKTLKKEKLLNCIAGCAGFASVLPDVLGLNGKPKERLKLPEKFLLICGSVNPITIRQLDYAEQKGILRIRLSNEERFKPEFWDTREGMKRILDFKTEMLRSGRLILDSNDCPGSKQSYIYCQESGLSLDEIRVLIAKSYGRILKSLSDEDIKFTSMITGGDTLMGCMSELGIYEMEPLYEMEPGVVLSSFVLNGKQQRVISKSGGFGSERMILNVYEQILEQT